MSEDLFIEFDGNICLRAHDIVELSLDGANLEIGTRLGRHCFICKNPEMAKLAYERVKHEITGREPVQITIEDDSSSSDDEKSPP
jgi:hypothetical protein